MTHLALRICALVAFCALTFQAQSSVPSPLTGFPFTDEDLNYAVNWPSGINLGESHLHARRSGANWDFGFSVDASLPGFPVTDVYHAESNPGWCSISFDRATVHGARKIEDKETIDAGGGTATRVAKNVRSEFPVPNCVKDALTYLFYAREELGQGRVPPAQQILYGGMYQMTLTYAGAPVIPVGGKDVQSDEVLCTVKGPGSQLTFQMFFARDPARSPLLVKVPFALGTFSMELIR